MYHTHDPVLVNRIANTAGVREFIRPDGEATDWTAAVEPYSTQTGIVALTNGEDAVGMFVLTHDNIVQAHTMFSPSCRGKRAIETGREMLDWLGRHGVTKVWGDTPRDNRKACWFNRAMGCVELPTSDETHIIFEKVLH